MPRLSLIELSTLLESVIAWKNNGSQIEKILKDLAQLKLKVNADQFLPQDDAEIAEELKLAEATEKASQTAKQNKQVVDFSGVQLQDGLQTIVGIKHSIGLDSRDEEFVLAKLAQYLGSEPEMTTPTTD